MPYDVELPNGDIIEVPDNVSQAEAKQRIYKAYPQFAPKQSTERTFGEAITDPLLGIAKGVGAMAQLPGQLYGLATGDFDTAAMRGPERFQEYAKSLQSEGLHVREALRDKAISEAEKQGIASAFYTAIVQTIKDPALVSTFITETVPEMIPMFLTGGASKLLTTGASQVAKYGAKEAAENAARVAARTAIGTGAVQQGADIGTDTYKEALDLARAQNPKMSPQEIEDLALSKARASAVESGLVSLLAQKLPGSKAIERRMAGLPGEGRIRSGLGEAASEMLEEGGGKFASNVNLQQIDPERSLTTGVGSAAGLGAIGGGILGAAIGRGAPVPELMPGQNRGETLAQSAERLQREIRDNEKLLQPTAAEKAISAITQAPIDPVIDPFLKDLNANLALEGNLNAGTTNAAPGGEGALLAGLPGAGGAAAGVAATQPDGVVLIGQDVAGTAGGEGAPPDSVEPVILQNRNRATPASIAQMQDISARPDYTRLGFSRDITTGAPVVFGGNINPQQLGKVDVVAAGNKKIPVQYAVMDVNNVIASNNADGSIVPEYSTAVDKTRVVGGNARIAGLQNAYRNNTAAAYSTELLGDNLHGISPDVIKGIKNPVLVRVMPASEVTKNIGDITNTTGTLDLSTVDQAKNDAKRVDVNDISYNEDGDVTDYSVMQFIRSMPANEHGKLIDDDGQPTTIARARLHAAIFAQAYQNDKLLRLYSQAVDPDAKNVLNALSQAAPQMARLEGAGALDFRNDVVAAAEQVVTAKKAGISTPDMVAQVTIGEDPNVHNILTGFANNIRSAKRMARILKEAANYAYHHANTEEQDMFGESIPKPSKEDITQGIKEGKEYPKLSRAQKGQAELFKSDAEKQQTEAKEKFKQQAVAQAPEVIAEKKEQFKNILTKILSNMGLKDVAVKLMNEVESVEAEGSYAENLIKIALDAASPVRTLRHEAIHALKELGFFSDNQWNVLLKQAKDVWVDKYLKNRDVGGGPLQEGKPSRYDAYMKNPAFKADPNAILEEAIADAFGDFDATKSPPGMIQAILKRMRDFFAGLKRALNGAGFYTSDQAIEQLFGKIERGELKAGEAKAGGKKLSLRTEQGKPAAIGPKMDGKFLERIENIRRQIGDAYVSGEISFDEYQQRFAKTNDDYVSALSLQKKFDESVGATSLEEVFPGFTYIPIGTKVLAVGRSGTEPARGTVIDSVDLRIGPRAYKVPVVDFGDGKRRKIGLGDIKEVFLPRPAKLSRRAPNTKEFKQWFGDSKVVDENGEPLVVYHGTAQSLIGGAFSSKHAKSEGLAFYFSHSPLMKNPAENANDYAKNRLGEEQQVMPVYLSIENPLVVGFTEPMPTGDAAIEKWLDRMGKFNRSIDMSKEQYFQKAIREAKKSGHDGVIVRNIEDVANDVGKMFTEETDVYIAFKPNQIKSAIGNIGTYSKENPDIRYSLRITKDNQIPDLGKDVTVAKVGKYFDDEVKKAFGSALDYNDKVAFDRAVDTATQEVLQQITQVRSGLDWYEEDIKTAFKDTTKIIPRLKKPESRILFTVMAGIMSPNTNARENWYIAAKAFEHYVNTKEIPGINPENGMLWMGGQQSANKKLQLDFLNNMVKSLKEGPAIKWLMSDHTVKEINEYRQKYGNIKSGIEGKATDVKPGLYAFGPKVGPFVSNLNGIHDVTVDKWMTRTFNRYFGTMVNGEGKIIDAPTEPQRRAIKELAIKVAQNVGIKPYQVQSVLWFYEQQLFTKLGAESPSYGFSDGGRRFLNERRGEGGTPGVPNAAAPNPRAKLSLRDKLGLYSELENKIGTVGPNQAPAAQWKTMIKGMVQKGVKPEEIEWSGVNDYLDLQEGKVSKAALLEYLKEGGVKVEETTLNAEEVEPLDFEKVRDFPDGFEEYYQANYERDYGQSDTIGIALADGGWWVYADGNEIKANLETREQAERVATAYVSFYRNKQEGEAKYNYGELILPGGTNYREVLLTLPLKPMTEAEARKILKVKPDAVLSQADIAYAARKNVNEYKSRHWDQSNVLAHIRINDRADTDGKKVLFVEEVQSDWGQQGKKEGFDSNIKPVSRKDFDDYVDKLSDDYKAYLVQSGKDRQGVERLVDHMSWPQMAQELGRADEYARMRAGRDMDMAGKTVIPVAPFVTKTEGWLNLALKRIMVIAAEGGYDKVAFINGKQSAKRYNLATYIDTIDYEKDDQGTYEFVATDKEGKTVYEKEEVFLSEIEGLVGKDIAKKIEAGEGVTGKHGKYRDWHTLYNLDLEVGEGKGMKVFYDQIVPIALKKLLTKVGGKTLKTVKIAEEGALWQYEFGGEVEEFFDTKKEAQDALRATAIDNIREYQNIENPSQSEIDEVIENADGLVYQLGGFNQPGFDVTPEMKQKIETTGLPKFSLRNTFSAQINAAVDRTTTVREDETWGDRYSKWIASETREELRAALINRYNRLGAYDRRRADKMGGFGLLADASAEAAAHMSDLGSSLTAAIFRPGGGAPVYKNGVTIVDNFGGTIKGPLEIFAPLEALSQGDKEIYRYYQFWAAVNMATRIMPSTANPKGTDITFKQSDIGLANQILARYPEFENIQKEWIKYNDKLAEFLVDTGVISKDAKDEWVRYGDYIPFYRQVDDTETIGPKLLQAIAGVKPPKKRKGGTEAPLADFLETIIRNTQSSVQMGLKNVAAQRAVLVAMDLNNAGQTDVIEPLNFVSDKPDCITILVNGQQKSFRSADKLWISSITSLNLPDVPFIGIFTAPANLLRTLVTKDPGFMLANMMRDSMQAMIASELKTVNPATTLANFASALAGRSPEFEALMNAGVLGGHEYSKDIVHSGKAFAKDLRKAAGQKTTAETLLSPVTGLWQALEKGATASDSATRQQIYKEVLENTKSRAYPNGNLAEAIYRSMEVMNFNRKGNSAIIRILTAAIPFLNARIQGLDVLYRTGFGIGMDKKSAAAIQKQFFIRGATMFALSCMYWALTHDDDDYKKQEQETKDNYWLLPSLGIKIPIPFEIGILFKVIPERIMAASFGTDTAGDFAKSMKRQLINTLDINWGIPQTFKPALEAVTNHSFFTDRPIVGQGMEGVEPGYQAGPNTSKIAAEIGKAANLSPMKIDHLISGYTGTMGMYAFNLFDSIFKMNDDKTYASNRFEQTPVFKRFLIDPNARGTVTAYYETKNAADSVVRTAALMERTMNYQEWGPYYKENMRAIATHEYLLDLEKTMKSFREMRGMIQANKSTPDEKRDALENLTKAENKLTANIQTIKKNIQ